MSLPVSIIQANAKWRLTLLLVVTLFNISVVSAGMIDKEGMANWEICGMCHGANGISAMAKFPKLAGQKEAYIKQQFEHFRSGERTNDGGQMSGITAEVKPSEVAEIAAYFASLPPPKVDALETKYLIANNAELFRRGQRLFYEAGVGGGIACANCHADKLSPAPWIDGQHRDYVQKQLEDFSTGRRSKGNNEIAGIVADLNEDDMAAVSLYTSVTLLNRE
jgi:cytochrome c553